MQPHILDLSDETLIHIFKYLDSTDLYNLQFVADRFESLVRDEYLWFWCDGRKQPNKKEKFEFCSENVNNKTRGILLTGSQRSETLAVESFFHKLQKLEHLTVLALESQYLMGDEVPLIMYPGRLQELSLSNSYVTSYKKFFGNCSSRLKSLHVLCLDHCQWFDSHSLLPLSKLESLEILSLYKCKQLSDKEVSYISLVGGHGFKRLKVLDVRFTGYGDEVLRSFYKSTTLGEVYFQGYSKTYHMECAMRKLDQLNEGSTAFQDLDPLLDLDDTCVTTMRNAFGPTYDLVRHKIQRLTNYGCKGYMLTKRDLDNEYVPPKSVLYQRPYGKCTCGYQQNTKIQEMFWTPTRIREVAQLQNTIKKFKARNVVRDILCLEPEALGRLKREQYPPEWQWFGEREPQTDIEISTIEHLSPNYFQRIVVEKNMSPVLQNILEVNLFRTDGQRQNAVEEPIIIHRRTVHRNLENPGRDGFCNSLSPIRSITINPYEYIGRSVVSRGIYRPETKSTQSDEEADKPGCSKAVDDNAMAKDIDVKPGCSKDATSEKPGCSKDSSASCSKDKSKDKKSNKRRSDSDLDNPKAKKNKRDPVCLEINVEVDDTHAFHSVYCSVNNTERQPQGDRPSTSNAGSHTVRINVDLHEEHECRPPNPPPVQHFLVRQHQPLRTVRMDDAHLRRNVICVGQLMGQNNGVWDAGVTKLHAISMRGYDEVTNASLYHLKHLNLSLIDVTNTQVTKEGVDMFMQNNPQCRVIHETACTCRPRLHF